MFVKKLHDLNMEIKAISLTFCINTPYQTPQKVTFVIKSETFYMIF